MATQAHQGESAEDEMAALTLQLQNIELRVQFLRDSILARSIADAVDTDAQAIAELVQIETQDEQDRRVALRMSGQEEQNLEAAPPYVEPAEDGLQVEDGPCELAGDGAYQQEVGPIEPTRADLFHRLGDLFHGLAPVAAHNAVQCIACTEEFEDTEITRLECGHQYCATCSKKVIMRGIIEHDLSLFPPRCCGELLLPDIVFNALSNEEMHDFQDASVEKSTRDKVYCSNATCGKFIAPTNIVSDDATCPRCGQGTCAACKNARHENECLTDTALQATLALGVDNQWQRCFSCHSLVAIELGCNHMTCRCGAEFCYQCGAEWRRCGCDLWAEENLVRRAEQVVDQERGPRMHPADRQRQIAHVQAQLRDADECDHRGRRNFPRIEGGPGIQFQCGMCNTTHRQFILRCRQCQLNVCMDCRLNRV